MKNIIAALDSIIKIVTILGIAGIVGVICLQIFCRFILNDALSWPEEAARFLMLWSLFLAGGYALRDREHIGLDFFLKFFPQKLKAFVTLLSHLLIIVFLGVVLVGGYQEVVSLMPLKTGALRISRGIPYLILPVSALFYIAVSLKLLVSDLSLFKAENERV